MNWGNSIVVAFVLFAGFILYMVVQAFSQNYDLVAEDYYAQEINYQQKQEQKTNLENLNERISVKLENQTIVLTFPRDQKPTGEIHFYHPSRKLFDQKVAIAMNSKNQQIVDGSDLIAGNYRVNITWQSNGQEYFQQEKIYIQ
ncbi:MAG: FixH family protein [Cyclobacteriaceae bacterium]